MVEGAGEQGGGGPDEERGRIVRLNVVPRDSAFDPDRPLTRIAQAHGGAFYRWLQRQIEASRPGITPVLTMRQPRRGIGGVVQRILRRIRRR